ncbi:cobaltochelatase subunit CobN [uncultured Methanobrevibacter sp.]|uniref:cobaltochelatase subunit CobN n=1 Tax=uncultured Methanobrevibacter sp. TaxID=253161 RepID=UPI0025D94813|nr:cobaltochelatase subunit CobN [uncultured Methanobrevibacter sp.]
MFCLKNKKYFCLLILLITIFIIPHSFALDNSTANDLSISDNEDIVLTDNTVEKSVSNNNLMSDSSKSQNITLFIVSDNPGTNILDKASDELSGSQNLSNINLVIRSGEQIKEMNDIELVNLLSSSDGFVGEWISSDVDSVLTSILGKNPELSNKKLFLILEPPSGKLNSGSSSIGLIRNNTINYQKIFTSFSDQELISYFENTKRGKNYADVYNYINRSATKFNPLFNQMVLYKNINDKENLKNQILYTLNFLGTNFKVNAPTFTGVKQYGIYRDRWYSLDEYIATFFNKDNSRTIGILESTMYVESQQLHPCYNIIESLESRGYNVIPVFAAGGSAEQLKVMIESWTSAKTDYSGFLSNPSNYDIYVDAIVSMVAYGVGGQNFSNATNFFEEVGVPVFRAVHSDYVSNEMWELGSTGLTTEKSDKWWHITIAETQGIIDATFVGGQSKYISNRTGAQITTYIPYSRNIDLLADRIDSWVDLKYTPNLDKLISIIYYNYPPGKQNIGSSYLDTITSIYNMLITLKNAGYDVGELPANVSELENLMLKCGINVATWAPGELEKLANQSGVTLLPVKEYTNWFNSLDDIVKIQVTDGPVAYIGELSRRAVELNYTATIGDTIDDWYNQVVALLPEENADKSKSVLGNIVSSLKDYTKTQDVKYYNLFLKYFEEFKKLNISGLNGWGNAPGNVMVVNRNGVDYFVIPGLTYGNIFIAPEPQRGWESDIENLYHCTAVAPTHQYLAAYYYMQTKYHNAMIFVGRHATHEWLPGKEILLSATDYGSVVVGDVPQLYFYIADGLAEAIQAKRRGFAVIISHLTSPMSYSHLYGNLSVAANLANDYVANPNAGTANKLRDLIIKNDYYTNLGLSKDEVKTIAASSLVEKVNKFLVEMQSTLYPLGLHALGQSWSEQDLASTVSAMLSYDYALDNNQGVLNLFTELSNGYFSKEYNQLSASQREFILNKSYDIVKTLIYWDVDTVNNLLISQNQKFDNPTFLACLELAKKYIDLINFSVSNELNAMLDGLNGKYVPVGEGGELVIKPAILPTGKNMFQDQSSELPTIDAWNYAKNLALLTLADLDDDTEKIIMGIWCVETARDDGALVSVVLYLLGMKPVWTDSSSAGYDDEGNPTGKKVSAMPEVIKLDDLTRPEGWDKKRIDVTVITSGLFRDLYSSQSILMDNAYRVALARSYLTLIGNATLMNSAQGNKLREALEGVMQSINYYGVYNEPLDSNYVAQHWIEDTLFYLSQGYNATYAGECAITRIFAPPNGDYGAGISKLVSMSWTWNDTSELADFYLGRMGNMYSKKYWGDTNPLVFLRALSNSDTIVASRNTNQYGVLDNDDFFDYWGGLSMTVEDISGKAPKFNVLMYADKNNAYISSLEEVMYKEIAARYDNPDWIKGMMKEGYSGARYMSNKFISNLHGWQVTRPSAVSNDLWDRIYDTYYNDKYNIGVKDWLMSGNNAYSLISMSGTMLTTIHEGYWNADKATISDIANTWAQATIQNGVACCDCSCGNIAMMQWAVQYVNPDILAQLLPKLYEATKNPVFKNNTQSTQPPETESNDIQKEASTQNPVKGSISSATVKTNSSSTTSQTTAQSGDNAQGEAFSNVGAGSESVQAGSSSAEGADVKKSVEINPISSQSASEVGLSIVAVLAILCLIMVVAVGYFRNEDDKDKVQDLDKLFNERG